MILRTERPDLQGAHPLSAALQAQRLHRGLYTIPWQCAELSAARAQTIPLPHCPAVAGRVQLPRDRPQALSHVTTIRATIGAPEQWAVLRRGCWPAYIDW